MRGAAGHETARSDVLLFVGCTVLALIALALPRPWALSVATGFKDTALRPLIALQSRAGRDREARFNLDKIVRARDSLAVLVLQQAALRRENDNLRGLVGVRARQTHRTISAEVLHQPTVTDARMLLLDVGSADGVAMFDPVITADGLIGSVVSTGPHNSSALTWSNPDFAASAVTADGHVFGFIHPATAPSVAGQILQLNGIPLLDSLAIGTTVLTAGAGGTYPGGIPIGRIVSVTRDVNGYDRVYLVVPFAAPGNASHVVVLISPRDSNFVRSPVPRATPPPPPTATTPPPPPAATIPVAGKP
jgi:rod shape-determining protein MreC